MTGPSELPTRRDQYAEMTRQAVIGTARQLFAERGYAATTIAQIARGARVSPATIYGQCGGKEGLLATLMDMWSSGQLVVDIISACAAQDFAKAKLTTLADGYVAIYDQFGDIIRIVTKAAVSVPGAQEFLDAADDRHLAALRQILRPLQVSGDLLANLSVDDAARIVFFHFRYDQWSLAADGFGWGRARATEWITQRVQASILDDTAGPSPVPVQPGQR